MLGNRGGDFTNILCSWALQLPKLRTVSAWLLSFPYNDINDIAFLRLPVSEA